MYTGLRIMELVDGKLVLREDNIELFFSLLEDFLLRDPTQIKSSTIRAIGKAVAFIDNTSYEMISVLPQGACIFTGVASNFPVLVQVDLLPKQQQPQSLSLIHI